MTKSKSAPTTTLDNASWYIEKARSYVCNDDPCAAKSWLLTAKTLYPTDITIQYEEFLMERKAGQKEKCAKLFYDMMSTFSNESILWEELARIFHAQDTAVRTQTGETRFLAEMFDSLAENQQKELLLKYANHQSDLVDKCRISMLVLRRFKGAARDQALKLMTTLRSEEEKEYSENVLNMYRKMTVCDVLPIILKHPDTHVVQQLPQKTKSRDARLLVTETQMIAYLDMMMEFLVSLAINKSSSLTTSSQSIKSELLNIDLEDTGGVSSWNVLHENLVLFANKLSWNNFLKFKDKIDPSKGRQLKSRWKTLNNARDSKPQIGLFYAVLQLHLYSVVEYCSSMAVFTHKATSPRPEQSESEFVLVENIDQMSQITPHQGVIKPVKKKRKSDESGNYSSDYQSSSEDVTVIVHPGLIGQVSEGLGECLQVAIETQNFLKSSFREEFEKIRDDWRFDTWNWMQTFDTDALFYQGKYRATIERLTSSQSPETTEGETTISLKNSLKLSSALFSSSQHKHACARALDTIAMLPPSAFESKTQSEEKNFMRPEGRSLLVLSNSPNDVLTYTVQLLFAALKSRLYGEGLHRDDIIGHLIVLSQYSWHKNGEFFLHLLKLLQAQDDGFTYTLFFKYVTQIEVLEEIAYLQAKGGVALNLLEVEEVEEEEDVQENFRTALMEQVAKSHQPVRNVIYNFLCKERERILEVI